MSYAMTAETALSYADAVAAIRVLLAEQGFGVLTEVDMRATMREKLGPEAAEELGQYLILGACNPPLARRALAAEPEVGLLLPCNVVVRRAPGVDRTTVEARDPQTMAALAGAPAMRAVADEAEARLRAALRGLPPVTAP